MGRYVPPELEGTTSGNALHRKKPPGQRLRASDGTIQQTVRFEMPFAVWCDTCRAKTAPTIIGQGVRFNATKTRAGNYHSTPIWSFRMRHAVCGGEIEIRTDPKNTAYVVASGGTRRDAGDDGPNAARDASGLVSTDGSGYPEGGLRILTDKERADMRASAFKQLERTIEDREQAAQTKLRIEEIEAAQATSWDDPYAANARLRKEFRVGRHEREKDGRVAEDLKDRMSLGIDLLPENELDARRAALVDFCPTPDRHAEDGRKALTKPLFATGAGASGSKMSGNTLDRGSLASMPFKAPNKVHSSHKKSKRLKSEIAAAQHKDSLVSEIVGNMRAAKDPFLVAFGPPTSSAEPRSQPATRVLAGIKRKQSSSNLEVAGKDTASPLTPGLKAVKTTNYERESNEKAGEVDVRISTVAAVSDKPTLPLASALVEYDSD